MNVRSPIRLSFFLALAGVDAVNAGTVIANKGLTLDAGNVKAVYNGELLSKSGQRLVPVDNLAEQSQFLSKVLDVDVTSYQNHWTRQSFVNGLSPPAIDNGDAEVIRFVEQNPGGVGYIGGAAPAEVKTVMTY